MTALPLASDFVGPITEGDFKAALTALRDCFAGVLGTDGLTATALSTLGALASVHSPKAAAYTVLVADRGKLIDATTGTWTLDLPSVASAGNGFSFMFRNSGTGTITIDPSGSELVDGVTTVTIAAGGGAVIICTGTAWVMQRIISRTMSTADFTLFDPADPTKTLKFKCDGIPTATTITIGVPNNNGNLITNNQSTTTIGNLATATTVNAGVGVTTTGVTKEVNLGPLGLSGSITNVNVGSQVSGALGTTTFYSPTVAFGASVTAINLPDVATFLVDSADPSKKIRIEVGGVTAATTRTYTAPNADGTLVLDTATQTLTNKSIAATQLTGTLQAAQEPAHSGDVTNSAGSLALTIAARAVTWAKAQAVATARLLGRTTAGSGDVEELTGTQVTAMLDVVTSGAKGLAPASGGGTTNFLRADLTWAAAGGGSSRKIPQIKAGSGKVTKFSNGAGGTGVSAASANGIRLSPYVPGFTESFSAFGIYCTTAVAGSNAKVIWYASDPATGWPTTLLGETADMSCATTGAKSASLSLTLTDGVLYWKGVRTSSTQSLGTEPGGPAIAGRAAFSDAPDPCVTRTLTYATAAQSNWTFLDSEISQYSSAFIVYGVTA